MKSRLLLSVLLSLGLLSACGKKSQEVAAPPPPVADLSGKFVFEPRLGTTYQHVMRRRESFEIVGTPVRSSEEWEAGWAMSITPSGENYVYRAELESLKIQLDDKRLLEGPEVAGRGGVLEMTMDPQGRIVDIAQTETLTRAMLEVSPPELRPQIAAMFSPQRLQLFFAMRVSERTQDLIGRPARVGASWEGEAPGPNGQPLAKKVVVREVEDCGDKRCVVVERTLHPDRGQVWGGAEDRVTALVSALGRDPQKVELLAAEVVLADELLVDPRTMEFHRARFEQSAELKVQAATGEYQVRMSTVRESEYDYAP